MNVSLFYLALPLVELVGFLLALPSDDCVDKCDLEITFSPTYLFFAAALFPQEVHIQFCACMEGGRGHLHTRAHTHTGNTHTYRHRVFFVVL